MSWKCPHPKSLTNNAHATMEKYSNSSKSLLFKICPQLDAQPNNSGYEIESSSSPPKSEENEAVENIASEVNLQPGYDNKEVLRALYIMQRNYYLSE